MTAIDRCETRLEKVREHVECIAEQFAVRGTFGSDPCADATANLAMMLTALSQAILMVAAALEVVSELNLAVQAAQMVKDEACTV